MQKNRFYLNGNREQKYCLDEEYTPLRGPLMILVNMLIVSRTCPAYSFPVLSDYKIIGTLVSLLA